MDLPLRSKHPPQPGSLPAQQKGTELHYLLCSRPQSCVPPQSLHGLGGLTAEPAAGKGSGLFAVVLGSPLPPRPFPSLQTGSPAVILQRERKSTGAAASPRSMGTGTAKGAAGREMAEEGPGAVSRTRAPGQKL